MPRQFLCTLISKEIKTIKLRQNKSDSSRKMKRIRSTESHVETLPKSKRNDKKINEDEDDDDSNVFMSTQFISQSTATNSSIKISVVDNDNTASNESHYQFNGTIIENNHVTEKNNQVPDELSLKQLFELATKISFHLKYSFSIKKYLILHQSLISSQQKLEFLRKNQIDALSLSVK